MGSCNASAVVHSARQGDIKDIIFLILTTIPFFFYLPAGTQSFERFYYHGRPLVPSVTCALQLGDVLLQLCDQIRPVLEPMCLEESDDDERARASRPGQEVGFDFRVEDVVEANWGLDD